MALMVGAVAFIAATASGQTEPDSHACNIKNDSGRPGKKGINPATLQPAANSQIRVVNFGTDREHEEVIFTVTADRPLRKGIVDRLNLVADPIVRTGKETAESVSFGMPTFSQIRPSGDHRRLRFTVCLDPPSGLPAGKYTGVITVEGPDGLQPTAVTITANAKNGGLFWIGVVVTLLLAALVLFYKEASDTRLASIDKAKTLGAKEKEEALQWRSAAKRSFNVGWMATTVAALVATFGALYAVWDNNPAWGEAGLVGSFTALVGIGLAAVGARTVLTPSTGKSPDQAEAQLLTLNKTEDD